MWNPQPKAMQYLYYHSLPFIHWFKQHNTVCKFLISPKLFIMLDIKNQSRWVGGGVFQVMTFFWPLCSLSVRWHELCRLPSLTTAHPHASGEKSWQPGGALVSKALYTQHLLAFKTSNEPLGGNTFPILSFAKSRILPCQEHLLVLGLAQGYDWHWKRNPIGYIIIICTIPFDCFSFWFQIYCWSLEKWMFSDRPSYQECQAVQKQPKWFKGT